MSNWRIPAKTFLLGEYAALSGLPAIVMLTEPCFFVSLKNTPSNKQQAIHPESPAGRFWQANKHPYALEWHDPYYGLGGLGASSAQFIGAYCADAQLKETKPEQRQLLDAYYHYAWEGKGLRPSGYDVITQCATGCLYIDTKQQVQHSYQWPFENLGFLLLHTANKLPTHEHLKEVMLSKDLDGLAKTVNLAKRAFTKGDAPCLIDAVNEYYHQLKGMHLVADHCQKAIESFGKDPDILAIKGCGAMGADVLLILVEKKNLNNLSARVSSFGWHILATQHDLYTGPGIFENFSHKTLEIPA